MRCSLAPHIQLFRFRCETPETKTNIVNKTLPSNELSHYLRVSLKRVNVQELSAVRTVGELLFVIKSDVPLENRALVEFSATSFVSAGVPRLRVEDLMTKHQRFTCVELSAYVASPIPFVLVLMSVFMFFALTRVDEIFVAVLAIISVLFFVNDALMVLQVKLALVALAAVTLEVPSCTLVDVSNVRFYRLLSD
jgi:hypothetical protein